MPTKESNRPLQDHRRPPQPDHRCPPEAESEGWLTFCCQGCFRFFDVPKTGKRRVHLAFCDECKKARVDARNRRWVETRTAERKQSRVTA